ncbi:hypothetical protein [Terricaulis sp.]|uniref:hypothetical protein n=1 Tax=Terricaulis sp. TaxID=2768686 RepID=UPI002AC5AA6E|nr:hypothetical protein [Terricaulis sp.]MDZ4691946.1 hypothetical protein [Terricaulis sp.]
MAAVAIVVSACARAPVQASCEFRSAHELAFTAPDAADTIVAESRGEACDKAVGLLVIRAADGYPIWSWSAPLSHRFGNVFAPDDTEHMVSFLEAWAQPEITTTQSAPAWDTLVPAQTTLDQLTYEDVRARDLPMLCHFSGTARQTCVFWEPAAGGAGHMLDRDAEEPEE